MPISLGSPFSDFLQQIEPPLTNYISIAPFNEGVRIAELCNWVNDFELPQR
jgi:hypothetical protein